MQYKFGKSIVELREQVVNNINQAAYDRINLDYPIWKQMNFNVRALELLLLGDSVSAEERKELKKLQTIFKHINSIRELSNTLVKDVASCDCPVQLRQLERDSINQIKNTQTP
jgi:hypothetical protein